MIVKNSRSAAPNVSTMLVHLLNKIGVLCLYLIAFFAAGTLAAASEKGFFAATHSIAVRTTENVTEGGWVWILEEAKKSGISRIDLLVKQDEDNYHSKRTDRVIQSGELLVELPGEITAVGWENSDWLKEMLARADELEIEIWAWWPLFHDSVAASQFPDAKFSGGDGSIFVDAAYHEVQQYQENLLNKLLDTYEFDGVSLDWLRYDRWENGSTGPLAKKFEIETGTPWTAAVLEDPVKLSQWGRVREREIARWLESYVKQKKISHPSVEWGGYLLPPQFKEVSQNYRELASAGLEYVQPMIYWSLWNYPAEWSLDVVRRYGFWANNETKLLPTLDLNRPVEEHLAAAKAMGDGRVHGFLWYFDFEWSPAEFARIRNLKARFREQSAQNDPGLLSSDIYWDHKDVSATFPLDTSVWTLVLLNELYRQGLLEKLEPLVPVLALHRFEDAPLTKALSHWANTNQYIDALFEFLRENEFNPIHLRDLQAYVSAGYSETLPAKSIILTVDDAAESVFEHFHPRALEAGFPYTLSVITSQMHGDHKYLDEHGFDAQMSWDDLRSAADSELVTLVSHTHEMHRYIPQAADGEAKSPALLANAWLKDLNRRETDDERFVRILNDLQLSRAAIQSETGQDTNVVAWPYGAFDADAEKAARQAGFTHFLNFGGSRFAKPTWNEGMIGRIPVTRNDELVPFEMPKAYEKQQGWWLAFLRHGRQSASSELLRAILLQLDDTSARHPEAIISRAAIDALEGRQEQARQRIAPIFVEFSTDLDIRWTLNTFLENYEIPFQ